MTRVQHLVILSWGDVIRRAIALGNDGAAYRLSRALVGRCRELGLIYDTDT
jgi:hypothetical protein